MLLYAAEYSSLKDRPFEYMMKVLKPLGGGRRGYSEEAQKQNLSNLFAKAPGTMEREYSDEEKKKREQDAYADMERLYGE